MTPVGPDSGTGPRVLLRRLREVMARPVGAQDRLDKTVDLIAANMVAEVCSIYIRRAGNALELFATRGLDRAAVHETRLKLGEGLVGEIAATAEPLNLADAPMHPKFAYRPETGEDPFHSFLGVPILKGGHVLGVLVVQNQTQRHYHEDEIEALQTVAMVLAEIVASGELINLDETVIDTEIRPIRPRAEQGVGFADGIALGQAVLHAGRVKVTNLIAENVEAERQRLEQGVEDLQEQIDQLLSSTGASLAGEPRDVLEAYRMFAHDRGWIRRMEEAVLNGLTAEAAVEQVQSDTRARLSRQKDPYLRERLHDLDDLANRLLRILLGGTAGQPSLNIPERAVLFARNLGPAELLDYERGRIMGVVLEEGSPSAHVAIVAKALGIPMVGLVEDCLESVGEDDWVIVDGGTGEIHIRPSADMKNTFEEKLLLRAQQQAEFTALRGQNAVTLDGQSLQLNMNAGLLVDLPNLDESGADGIGLFRTELQFMVSATMPRLSAQKSFYEQVLSSAGDRPVVFRTLDLGGDKILPYARSRREENPALGLRAIRLALARPALLRYQLRALLLAGEGHDLRLMFPMVAEVDEFRRARQLLDLELERVEHRGGKLPARLSVGCMLEVPSLVWQLPTLLPLVDFVSVGSNDLLQFFFASDRGNPQVANTYDVLSPASLSLLRHIVLECQRQNKPVGLCGEVAGHPLEAMALLGLGFRAISMPPACVGPVKFMARRLHTSDLAQAMSGMLERPDHTLRHVLKEYADRSGVPV